jgi:hypothetical protein
MLGFVVKSWATLKRINRLIIMNIKLIAPCGMNCGICLAYLRKDKKCPGCREDDASKNKSCVNCIIKNCEKIKTSKSGFCYECAQYPCQRLKQLDKRYRTKYLMSMLENLESIKIVGLVAFVKREGERWHCPQCGGVICVHRHCCFTCGLK